MNFHFKNSVLFHYYIVTYIFILNTEVQVYYERGGNNPKQTSHLPNAVTTATVAFFERILPQYILYMDS